MAMRPNIVSPETHLLDIVIRGNVDHVRRYLDESLAGHKTAKPCWTHLKIALEQKNQKMARLLVTWGAIPTRQQLAEYFATHSDTAARDVQMLKLAGVNVTNIDLGIAAADFNAQARSAPTPQEKRHDNTALLPTYWGEYLAALAAAGAPEAVVAGGALRDIYHQRRLNNVDIFIKAPFMPKSFMKKFVAALPRKLYLQHTEKGDDAHFTKIKKRLGAMSADRYLIGDPLDRTDTWRVIDRASGMEFHIVMLGSELGSALRNDHKNGTTTGVNALLERFDIGLCQIAYDGKKVITTAAYRDDAKFKTLTVHKPMYTTMEHIAAVVAKYPDFRPNDKLADILRTGQVPERPMPAPILISSRAYM